ncbi:uncharacterized protein CDAR_310071 [Caerostris darwini]|uniref:Uncharacterized protein n=1 Tax=Caerostris darwini TaxID=1538125 RepID=A0AAV4WQG9_9ARAC|nr:uncharacterized protein CDAR_310071 [Caerostris darwini]
MSTIKVFLFELHCPFGFLGIIIQWYDVDLDLVDCEIKDVFFPSQEDDETEDFLENCFEKSDWLMTQIFHALARSLLCWFMSRTSING